MGVVLFYAAVVAVLWLLGVGFKAIVLTCLAIYGTGWIAFFLLAILSGISRPKARPFR